LKLSVLIPALNEEKTIGTVIDEIPKNIDGISNVEVIVINDGSDDKTAEVAKNRGAIVYSFVENKGLAKAISYGFSKALERKTDILVILDADNQYDSKEIPKLIQPIIENKVDIVLGDRQVRKLDHMPFQKRIGNRMTSKILSYIIGKKISDGQTGFRAFSSEALRRIRIFSNYTYTQETIIQAVFKDLTIKEIPVTFRKRYDESRLISNIFTYAGRTITLVASTILFYKSFKFFGILSLVLFAIGIGLSVFILNHFYATGTVAPYYPSTMLAILFLVTGSISALMTIISSILRRQSMLLEEINYQLRKSGNNLTNTDESD